MHLVYEDYKYDYTCSELITCSDTLICGYMSVGNLEGFFAYYNVKGYYGYVERGKNDNPNYDKMVENQIIGGMSYEH